MPDQFPRLGSRSHIFLSLRLPLWARCHAVSRCFGVSLAWGSRAVARGRLAPWDMIPRVRPPAARRRGKRHVRQATCSACGWGIGAALPWKHVERARLDTKPNVLPGVLAASSLLRSRLPLWTGLYHTPITWGIEQACRPADAHLYGRRSPPATGAVGGKQPARRGWREGGLVRPSLRWTRERGKLGKFWRRCRCSATALGRGAIPPTPRGARGQGLGRRSG